MTALVAFPALVAVVALLVTIALLATCGSVDVSSIGGTLVPDALRCMEDEVVAFVGVDTLDCVHIDSLR